jgi:hypothetical protein
MDEAWRMKHNRSEPDSESKRLTRRASPTKDPVEGWTRADENVSIQLRDPGTRTARS